MKKQTSPGLHLRRRKNKQGLWRYSWRVFGKNGRQLSRSSETFNSEQSCIKDLIATQKIFGGTNSLTDWTGKEPVTRPIVFP